MAGNEAPSTKKAPGSVRQGRLKGLFYAAAVVSIAGAATWWFMSRNLVGTDDAYVKADSSQISSRVAGTVIKVVVDNDSPVEEGHVLIELDPTDYRVAVDKAKAGVDMAEGDVAAAETMVAMTEKTTAARTQVAEAALKAAKDKERETRHRLSEADSRRAAVSAEVSQVEKDNNRYEALFRKGAGTERQQEVSRTDLKKAKAQLGATEAQKAAIYASLGSAGQDIDRSRAQLDEALSERNNVEVQKQRLAALKGRLDTARAELEAARLNESYCVIKAPIDGYVAQKNVQLGDRVQAGQTLMSVVPLHDAYAEGNFKETQLTNVRIGQPVQVRADMYPGVVFKGRVSGIRAGTGAAFSLLPPENATGNWIKVVQRIPVKIVFDGGAPQDHPLRVGMSLDVSIDTSDRSGPMLAPPVAMSSGTRAGGKTSP